MRSQPLTAPAGVSDIVIEVAEFTTVKMTVQVLDHEVHVEEVLTEDMDTVTQIAIGELLSRAWTDHLDRYKND